MGTNTLSLELTINEIEKQIAIICREMTTCVDRLPYGAIQKTNIYLRIASAMLQASQCEMSDAIHEAFPSTGVISLNTNPLNTSDRKKMI